MSFIDLDFDTQEVDAVIADLDATEHEIDAAVKSTMVKMARWLKTRSVKGLSSHLQIQQKVIRKRLRQYSIKRVGDGYNIRVWFGLDPIDLKWLKPRQTKAGVSYMGGRSIGGAFLVTHVKNPKSRGMIGRVFTRRGRDRLSIDKQEADVSEKAQTYLEDMVIGGPEFEAQLIKYFEHEIEWRTQKRK